MIGLLFAVVILLVIAWAAYTYLPHPAGVFVAVVAALLALYVLFKAVVVTDSARAALALLL